MNPTLSITLLLTGLQVAGGQKVTSLTACLEDQSLRLDCRHENTTTLPMQFEFSLTRDAKKHVLLGNMGVPEHTYRSRTNLTNRSTLKVLYLSGFSSKDEGVYTCELQLSGQTTTSHRSVSVLRGQAGQVQGRQPAGPGCLVAAAAAALPASPAGRGFRLPVTCDLCPAGPRGRSKLQAPSSQLPPPGQLTPPPVPYTPGRNGDPTLIRTPVLHAIIYTLLMPRPPQCLPPSTYHWLLVLAPELLLLLMYFIQDFPSFSWGVCEKESQAGA